MCVDVGWECVCLCGCVWMCVDACVCLCGSVGVVCGRVSVSGVGLSACVSLWVGVCLGGLGPPPPPSLGAWRP